MAILSRLDKQAAVAQRASEMTWKWRSSPGTTPLITPGHSWTHCSEARSTYPAKNPQQTQGRTNDPSSLREKFNVRGLQTALLNNGHRNNTDRKVVISVVKWFYQTFNFVLLSLQLLSQTKLFRVFMLKEKKTEYLWSETCCVYSLFSKLVFTVVVILSETSPQTYLVLHILHSTYVNKFLK